MRQNTTEGTGQRHFQSIKDPGCAERTDNQPMPATPRHSVQPRRNVRFDPFTRHFFGRAHSVSANSASSAVESEIHRSRFTAEVAEIYLPVFTLRTRLT